VASTTGAPELTESEFHAKADATLEAIECVASALDETIRDGFDVSLSTGVLTLKLGGKGTYVLNKQTPNRQLWWSSPVSGPKRYAWDGAARDWRNTRDGHAMTAKLAEELRGLTGAALDFSSAAAAAADAHGA
jgi:frataxin